MSTPEEATTVHHDTYRPEYLEAAMKASPGVLFRILVHRALRTLPYFTSEEERAQVARALATEVYAKAATASTVLSLRQECSLDIAWFMEMGPILDYIIEYGV